MCSDWFEWAAPGPPLAPAPGDDGGVPRCPSRTRDAHQATVLQCREERPSVTPTGSPPWRRACAPCVRVDEIRLGPGGAEALHRALAKCSAGAPLGVPAGSAPLGEPHWASLSSEPYSPLGVSRGNGWSRSYLVKLTSVTLTVLASVRSMKNVFQRGLALSP